MDFKILSEKYKEFSDQRGPGDPNKDIYSVISSVIGIDEFISLIPDAQKRMLDEVARHYDSGRDLNWIYSQQSNIVIEAKSLYFFALTYLSDRRKNISHFEKKTADLEKRIIDSNENITHINEIAKLISGASVLAEYSKDFDKQSAKHEKTSLEWLKYFVYSVIGFVGLLGIVFFIQLSELPILKSAISDEIKSSEYFNIFAISIKAALVFAYLQIPGFIKRNYFAEKHLQQSYLHRRNVLKSLHAVYNTISDPLEKDKIITIGATIAFSENESGYITTKEGAGDDDASPTLLSLLISRK